MLHLSNVHSDYSAPVFAPSQGSKQRGVKNIFASLLRSLGTGDTNAENLTKPISIRIDINADGSLKSPENLQSKLLQMLKKNASDPHLKTLLNQWNKGKVDIFLPIQLQSVDGLANTGAEAPEKQNSKSIGLLRVFKAKIDGDNKLAQLESSQIGVGFVFDEKSAEIFKFTGPGKSNIGLPQKSNARNSGGEKTSNTMLLVFSNSLDAPFIAGKVDSSDAGALQLINIKNGTENLGGEQNTVRVIQQKNVFGKRLPTSGQQFNTTKEQVAPQYSLKTRSGINIDGNISEKHTGINRSERHPTESTGQKKKFNSGRVKNLRARQDLSALKLNPTSDVSASESKVSNEEKIPGAVKWNKNVGESELTSGKLNKGITLKSNGVTSEIFTTNNITKTNEEVSRPSKSFVSGGKIDQNVESKQSQSAQSIHRRDNSQNLASDLASKIQQNQSGNRTQIDPESTRLIYVNLDGGSKLKSSQKVSTMHLAKLLEKLQGNVQFSTVERSSHIPRNQNVPAAKKQSEVVRTFTDISKNTFARESVEVHSKARQTEGSASQRKSFNLHHSQRVSASEANDNHLNASNMTSQAKHSEKLEITASGYSSVKTATQNGKPKQSWSPQADVLEKSQKSSYSEKAHKSKKESDQVRHADYTPKHSDERSLHTSLETGRQSNQQDGNTILQGKTELSGVIANSARSSLTQSVTQNHTQSMMHQVIERFETMVQQLQSSQMQSRGNWLQARIALKPAELGSVMLTLRFKNDVLHGKIFTESKQSKHAIEKHLPAIQEAMNKHQTSVQNIKVEVRSHFDPQQDQPDFQQQFSQQQGEAGSRYTPQSRYNRRFGAQSTPEPETVGLSAVRSTLTDNRINFYA